MLCDNSDGGGRGQEGQRRNSQVKQSWAPDSDYSTYQQLTFGFRNLLGLFPVQRDLACINHNPSRTQGRGSEGDLNSPGKLLCTKLLEHIS